MKRKRTAAAAVTVAATAALVTTAVAATSDWGAKQQDDTRSHALQLFGVSSGLAASSSDDLNEAQAIAHPEQLFQLAGGLKARILTSTTQAGHIAAPNVDMMALWPNDAHPTHLVYCNEQGTSAPGVQRVDLATGEVATIVTGTNSCDGVRRTAWGTVLFSEENGTDGRVYELYNPLETTGVHLDRVAGTTDGGTGAANVVVRPALGKLSYEGFALYPSGLVYYGDENRPSNGLPGGAIYKFVPTHQFAGGAALTNRDDSPFASGTIYGLRLGTRNGNTDYGQGTETGKGSWITVGSGNDINLRSKAPAPSGGGVGLTGFYRPEDIDVDQAALRNGDVRFCGPMTGNEEDDESFGSVVCFTDGTLAGALDGNTTTPVAQRLVDNNPQFAMPDNIAYQPGRGNWVIHEDADTTYHGTGLGDHNDDLWSCLDDGADDDLQSDGCLRIATLRDLDAEWTGGIFDATGTHFYVSVQHNSSGKGVILDITGWR